MRLLAVPVCHDQSKWCVAPPRARAIYFLQGNKELGVACVVCPDLDKKDKGKYLLV